MVDNIIVSERNMGIVIDAQGPVFVIWVTRVWIADRAGHRTTVQDHYAILKNFAQTIAKATAHVTLPRASANATQVTGARTARS